MLKKVTYFLIFAAALATAIIGAKSLSSPLTFRALGFISWAVSPYAYLALATTLVSGRASIVTVFALSLMAGSFGVWLLIDTLFMHPDAQSGLIFIFAPLWQWAFLALTALPLYFLNRVKSA